MSIHLGPVVQTLDSAIHWINHYSVGKYKGNQLRCPVDNHWTAQLVSLILIHWIVIYPLDSAIQLLNNWGQAICQRLVYRCMFPRTLYKLLIFRELFSWCSTTLACFRILTTLHVSVLSGVLDTSCMFWRVHQLYVYRLTPSFSTAD